MRCKTVLFSIFSLSMVIHGGAADQEKVKLFDGRTLEGWNAPDLSYWSVEDGAITAISSEENPCTKNQFLVWQGGEPSDFRLTLEFRVEGGPRANSGIQIRSRVLPDGHAVGYQVDISQPEALWLGAVYDEHGRKMLAARGESTTVQSDGEMVKTDLAESAKSALAGYRKGEWNTFIIEAKGNRILVKLNGHVTAGVVDEEEAERELSGIIALQLHSGPPMKVQFRNIVLETL